MCYYYYYHCYCGTYNPIIDVLLLLLPCYCGTYNPIIDVLLLLLPLLLWYIQSYNRCIIIIITSVIVVHTIL